MAVKRGPMWRTKNGVLVPIREMTNTHLLNAERLLRRHAARLHDRAIDSASEGVAIFGPDTEAARSAEDALDRELTENTLHDYLPPIHSRLEQEIQRRGLEPLTL